MQTKNNNHFSSESSQSGIEQDESELQSPNWAIGGSDGELEQNSDSDEERAVATQKRLTPKHEDDEDSLNQDRNEGISSDSEESSLDEDDREYVLPNNGIHTVREDSQEGSDDQESIDNIEKRIKKLEKDLEGRLRKHGANPIAEQKTLTGKNAAKSKIANPPIPQRISNSKSAHLSIENRTGSNEDPKKPKKNAEFFQDPPIQLSRDNKNTHGKKEASKAVPKEPQPAIPKEEPKPLLKDKEAQMKKLKSKKKSINQSFGKIEESNATVLTNKRIQQMQTTIEDLKNENQKLRKELKQEKDKQTKKPIQELEKLRNISSTDSKLEKELELLEVIEKLQAKLKKSINRKLSANTKAAGTAILFHKGLPASTLLNP